MHVQFCDGNVEESAGFYEATLLMLFASGEVRYFSQQRWECNPSVPTLPTRTSIL